MLGIDPETIEQTYNDVSDAAQQFDQSVSFLTNLFGGKLVWGLQVEEFNNRWKNPTWFRFLGMNGYWNSAEGKQELATIYPGMSLNDVFYKHFGMRFSLWEPGLSTADPYFLFDPRDLYRLPQTQYTKDEVAQLVRQYWPPYATGETIIPSAQGAAGGYQTTQPTSTPFSAESIGGGVVVAGALGLLLYATSQKRSRR